MLRCFFLAMLIGCAYGAECRLVGSKVIKVFRYKKNWNDARSFCRGTSEFGAGGDLVVDTDSETHRFIASKGVQLKAAIAVPKNF